MTSSVSKKASPAFEPFALPYVTQECMGAGFGHIRTVVETISQSMQIFMEANNELQKNYRQLVADEVKISQEAGICRTPYDFLCLRQKLAQKWLDNYLKENHKLYKLIAKNYMPLSLQKACLVME